MIHVGRHRDGRGAVKLVAQHRASACAFQDLLLCDAWMGRGVGGVGMALHLELVVAALQTGRRNSVSLDAKGIYLVRLIEPGARKKKTKQGRSKQPRNILLTSAAVRNR